MGKMGDKFNGFIRECVVTKCKFNELNGIQV